MAEWYCSSTRPPPAFPASPIAMAQSPGQSAHSDIVFMTEAEDGAERGAAAKFAYLPVGFGPPPEAPHGLRLDFNLGCRVLVPSGNWHPRPRELKTSSTLGETTIGSSALSSSERTFIRPATRRVHRRTVPRRMGIAARAAGRDPADCRTLSAHLGAELLRAKYSANRNGWRETVAPLRANGCRVVCIDQKPAHGQSVVWTEIPCCAEAQTGDRRLVETLGWLRHAVAFVDLSNGPGWLAQRPVGRWSWSAASRIRVMSLLHRIVLLTMTRVTRAGTNPGRWSDYKHFVRCPEHAATPRQFQRARLITTHQVGAVVQSPAGIPGRRCRRPPDPFALIFQASI